MLVFEPILVEPCLSADIEIQMATTIVATERTAGSSHHLAIPMELTLHHLSDEDFWCFIGDFSVGVIFGYTVPIFETMCEDRNFIVFDYFLEEFAFAAWLATEEHHYSKFHLLEQLLRFQILLEKPIDEEAAADLGMNLTTKEVADFLVVLAPVSLVGGVLMVMDCFD